MIALKQGQYLGAVQQLRSTNGVLVGVTEYHRNDGTGPMHYHDNTHFSFVLHGAIAVKRKPLTGPTTAIETFSLMRAGEWHQNTLQSERSRNMNLEFEPAFFRRYDIDESAITTGSPLLMVKLYKELLMNDEAFNDSVHMLLLSDTTDWKNTALNTPPSWLKTVKELLHDRWNEPVGLNELAEAVNMHPVSVSKYFARYFKTTLGEYRRKIKIEKALELMSTGRVPLTNISYACGFYDQSHFIKAFKDLTTMLPRDFCKVTR